MIGSSIGRYSSLWRHTYMEFLICFALPLLLWVSTGWSVRLQIFEASF